ncbi:MAG TPA: methyltransferase domain-containing protein [Thermoanaerobaculia bacterium]|nr:methyltransferase domain-containing protein [Thermoanaerobaculia bacterium]
MNAARGSSRLFGLLRLKKPETAAVTGGEQPTLALGALLQWLAGRSHPRVVDLGSAHGDNLALFSRYGCRLDFLDLYPQLRETAHPNPASERERTRQLVARTLGLDPGTPEGSSDPTPAPARHAEAAGAIDVLLVWDLLNYLSVPQIEGLYRALRPLCDTGTRAFLMLAHAPTLPLQPRRLRIAAADKLIWDQQAPSVRPCPQYSEHQLHKLFPDFAVERSFLMRHGVREYLLAIPEPRRPSGDRPPPPG